MKYSDDTIETDAAMIRQEPAYNMTDSSDNSYQIKGVLTVSDLEETPEDRRVELINGVFYDMAEPLILHQNIVGEIFGQLREFIYKNKGSCKPYVAPVGVRPNADDDHTVLEPDVFVVCDPEKQKHPRYIIGGPDLVVEVLSVSTKKRDMTIKKQIYHDAGVREYWIVDPEEERVLVHDFEHGNVTYIHSFEESVPVRIYENALEIDLREFVH